MAGLKYILRQLKEVREGGRKVLGRKLVSLLNRLLVFPHGIWAIPSVILVRLIRPWKHFRFGTFEAGRIGHFVADVVLALAESDLGLQNHYSDWYFLPPKTCNQQWEKMTRRMLHVRWWVRYLDAWNRNIPGGKVHQKLPAATTLGSRDKHGWWKKSSAQKIAFLPEEGTEAKSWLRHQGWREGEPFVCLLVRDSAYLNRDSLHGWSAERSHYHNYRDSDITTYVQAAEYLAESGVWVLRMGKVMKSPIPSQHYKVVDYAFQEQKNDLLDVWLFANCIGCISTGTGIDRVSYVYGKPILFVNTLPLSNLDSYNESIWVSKHLIWSKSGESLSLRQYLENSYLHTQEYTEAGIEIVDLSSEEILEAVQEFWQRIQGTWEDDEDDILCQQQFWIIFKAWPEFSKYHGWIHPESRVGAAWLRSQGEVFFA